MDGADPPYDLETVDTDDEAVDDPVDVNWTAEAQGNLLQMGVLGAGDVEGAGEGLGVGAGEAEGELELLSDLLALAKHP